MIFNGINRILESVWRESMRHNRIVEECYNGNRCLMC